MKRFLGTKISNHTIYCRFIDTRSLVSEDIEMHDFLDSYRPDEYIGCNPADPVSFTLAYPKYFENRDKVVNDKRIILNNDGKTIKYCDIFGNIGEAVGATLHSKYYANAAEFGEDRDISLTRYCEYLDLMCKEQQEISDMLCNENKYSMDEIDVYRAMPRGADTRTVLNDKEEISEEQAKLMQVNKIEEQYLKDEKVVSVIEKNGYFLDIKKRGDGITVLNRCIPSSYCGSVTVPDGVINIEPYAFYKCKACEIKLPSSIEIIGDGAFMSTMIEDIVLPPKVTAIKHRCFSSSNIYSINMDRITSIGNFAFSNTNISDVRISGVKGLGLGAYENCKLLSKFVHTSDLEKIRGSAFYGCKELTEFDFTGVCDIEASAFLYTGLSTINIVEPIKYIKTNTFSGNNISEVRLCEGCIKLGAVAVKNLLGEQIVYTIPRSMDNLGKDVFTLKDIVRCYQRSVAVSVANMCGATVEYIDADKEFAGKEKVLNKLKVYGGGDVSKVIKDYIQSAYNEDDVEFEYEIDESKLINIQLDKDTLDMIRVEHVSVPDDYKEKGKFKVLLEHYSRVSQKSGKGLASSVLAVRDTFTVTPETIYTDGISRVYELLYEDDKYECCKGKYIVFMTGDTVRYCCLCNRNTNVTCKEPYSKYVDRLLNLLSPGDTLGAECILSGERFSDVVCRDVTVDKDGKRITMNLYQALFNSSIAVKLDGNRVALILPTAGKVMKCNSVGKSVWNNETDETYKVKSCVIECIEDLKNNAVFDYGKTPNTDCAIFDKISGLRSDEIEERILSYATIGKAEPSEFVKFRDYCRKSGITSINEIDSKAVSYLLELPIIEKKAYNWFEKDREKTIVKASFTKIQLADGGAVAQYQTLKRSAMMNKLITGGDRTIYVYVLNNNRYSEYVYAGTMEMTALIEHGFKMAEYGESELAVFKNKGAFDIVPSSSLVVLSNMFHTAGKFQNEADGICLIMYKPNGKYYIANVSRDTSTLLIQVGDIGIAAEYIQCATTAKYRGSDYLNFGFSSTSRERKQALMRARDMIIDGEIETSKYLELGITPVLCHMMGV